MRVPELWGSEIGQKDGQSNTASTPGNWLLDSEGTGIGGFRKEDKKMDNLLLQAPLVETLADFLIELDMKLCMHLVEISIFSLNIVTLRLTKIMNNLLEHHKVLIFKVVFQCWKLVKLFRKKFCEEYWTRRPTLIKSCFWKFGFLRYFFSKNVPNFCQFCSWFWKVWRWYYSE